MASGNASVDAAKAKKAEGASILALLKPIPAFFTGSVIITIIIIIIIIIIIVLYYFLSTLGSKDPEG